MRGVALTLAALFTAGCATAADGPGALVIAGGGLKSDTAAVWQAFLAETPDGGPIVIVASASGDPVLSAASVEQTLLSYGIPRDRIRTAKLATMDDRSTPDVDESLWSANGRDPDTFALLRGASALWFTGGDQSRTTQILLGTPALDAVRDARRNGAPIGGTSAGAAIMSDPMITQGDTLSALGVSEAGEGGGRAPGRGFLPGVVGGAGRGGWVACRGGGPPPTSASAPAWAVF